MRIQLLYLDLSTFYVSSGKVKSTSKKSFNWIWNNLCLAIMFIFCFDFWFWKFWNLEKDLKDKIELKLNQRRNYPISTWFDEYLRTRNRTNIIHQNKFDQEKNCQMVVDEKYILLVFFSQVYSGETVNLFKKDKWNQKMRWRCCKYVSKYLL